MNQITNKEYEEWQKYKAEKAKGYSQTLMLEQRRRVYDITSRSCL